MPESRQREVVLHGEPCLALQLDESCFHRAWAPDSMMMCHDEIQKLVGQESYFAHVQESVSSYRRSACFVRMMERKLTHVSWDDLFCCRFEGRCKRRATPNHKWVFRSSSPNSLSKQTIFLQASLKRGECRYLRSLMGHRWKLLQQWPLSVTFVVLKISVEAQSS